MSVEMSVSGSRDTLGPGQPDWRSRLQAWRARQVARPAFRRFVQRLPLSRAFARAREEDLFSIVTGFVRSQILFAALQSGLIDAVAGGPATVKDLARATGFREDRLKRLLLAPQSKATRASGP